MTCYCFIPRFVGGIVVALLYLNGLPASADPYPTHISGAWGSRAEYFGDDSEAVARKACASYRANPTEVTGDILVFQGSKKFSYGGYVDYIDNNLVVKQLGPNKWQVTDRHFEDGEQGRVGYHYQSYEVTLSDDILTIKDGKYASRFSRCTVAAMDLPTQPESTVSKEGIITDNRPSTFAAVKTEKQPSRLPAGVEPLYAKSIEECQQPGNENFALSKDATVFINGQKCTTEKDNSYSNESESVIDVTVSCNGTTREVAGGFKRYTFLKPVYGVLSMDSGEPKVLYLCPVVKQGIGEGATAEGIEKNGAVITKEVVDNIYDTYMYDKICSDFGFQPNNIGQILAFMRSIDDMAKVENIDTAALWREALSRAATDSTLNILRNSFNSVKMGAGGVAAGQNLREGCNKFGALLQAMSDDYRAARDPNTLIRFFNLSGLSGPPR